MSHMVKIEKESGDSAPDSPSDHYPYGTRLELEGELVDELELGKFSAGDAVVVRALAVVCNKSERVDDDGDEVEKRVCLQLTGIQVAGDKGSTVAKMYGDGEGED